MPIPDGMHGSSMQHAVSEVEAALLGALLSAETARDGASALLAALAPVIDGRDAALALRDRDGFTLHLLAETGASATWPDRLEPQFALGAHPGVDRATDVLVVPIRAHGRVLGALMFADPGRAQTLLHSETFPSLLNTTAEVLHAIVSRLDVALQLKATQARSLDAIVDSMSHQIANPLTGASAIAQLLEEDLTDEGQRSAVRQMSQELNRAFVVLKDLLDFHRDTRAQDGFLDLSTIVERVVRFRGYAIREQGITLDFTPAATYMPVRADARGIEHALMVALRFAELRSHGGSNRYIAVAVIERGGEQCVEITDSGAGDIPDTEPRYFDLPLAGTEQFARATQEEPDLGLVRSILGAAGGRLEVRASKTEGTTLALVLPRPPRTSNSTVGTAV